MIPPAEKLLARLEGVNQTAADRWRARCPGHDSKSRTLAIRELPDSTLLIKCFAGCGAADVIEATGLQLRDLFPLNPEGRRAIPAGQRWVPREAMGATREESVVCVLAAAKLLRGEKLSDKDSARLELASVRLAAAASECGA